MRLNWEKMKAFHQVAAVGSITKAAELNNKTVAALSNTIRSFEEELQIKLFIRTQNKLELTKEGIELFSAASHVYNVLKAKEDTLYQDINSQSGRLRITASSGFTSMYISNYIHEFMYEHPDIRLEFVAMNNLTLPEKKSGDILIHPYIEGLSGFKQEALIKLDLKLFAAKEYLKRFGIPQSVTDLDHHQLIAFSQSKRSYADLNWHLKVEKKEGSRTPILEVDETFGRCRLCATGVGIISVPKQHPEIKKYELVEVLPDLKGPSVTYYIIVDEMIYSYGKVQVFIKYLKEKFYNL